MVIFHCYVSLPEGITSYNHGIDMESIEIYGSFFRPGPHHPDPRRLRGIRGRRAVRGAGGGMEMEF